MNSTMATRMLPRAMLVLALIAAAGLAVWKHTLTVAAGQPVPQPGSVPVNTVQRACAGPGLAGSPASHLALIAGPAASGTGRAVVSRLGTSPGAPLLTLDKPGVLSQSGVSTAPALKIPKTATTSPSPSPSPGGQAVATVPTAGGVLIQASGSMARGLEAEQYAGSGEVALRCDGPGTDFWFAGPGVFTTPNVYLYLMNPGSQPADVNVLGYTDAGPLITGADTGIAVAPHTMVMQSLGKMLHGTRAMALNVRTSVGQIVAAVETATGSGHSGAWLPSLAPPAKQAVLPGMPSTPGTRQLFVTVPGTQDAHITLRAVTPRGAFEPTGGSGLDIPGGSVAQLSLPSLSTVTGALELSSSQPVTASMLVPASQHGAPGVFAAAAPAIQEQGVVADNLSGGGTAAMLVLSAPWRGAQVRVTEIPAGSGGLSSAGPGTVVRIPARRSVVQRIGRAAGSKHVSSFAVIVTPLPGSGPLYAGRVIAGGGKAALQSILAVPGALTVVPLAKVRNGLAGT